MSDKNQILTFHTKKDLYEIEMPDQQSIWLTEMLEKLFVQNEHVITYGEFKTSYEKQFHNFESFWESEAIDQLRRNGLLLL